MMKICKTNLQNLTLVFIGTNFTKKRFYIIVSKAQYLSSENIQKTKNTVLSNESHSITAFRKCA